MAISTRGTMKERSRPVSSIIRTIVEIGPCVDAAKTAPAPRRAKSPAGTPGQNHDHPYPRTPPSIAPAVREAVNSPPGAPQRTLPTVAAGFKTTSASNRSMGTSPEKAIWDRSLPLPKICGKRIETTPSNPRPAMGTTNLRQFSGLCRSAHVMSRTYPTENSPAIGPANKAHPITGAELAAAYGVPLGGALFSLEVLRGVL